MKRFLAAVIIAAGLVPVTTDAAVMGMATDAAGHPAVPVYVARPEGPGPFPAVIFLHGCDGINGLEAIAADRLAAHGYVGVALDELGFAHPGGACESDGSGQIKEAAAARVVLAWLRTQSYVASDRLGLVGFSMGANAILDIVDGASPAPVPSGLRAVVAYYPACDRHDGGSASVPLAIFDGDADHITPSAPCIALARAATAAGKLVDLHVYPGATHAFNVPGPEHIVFGDTVRFDQDATADSALRTLTFLSHHLQ